MSTPFADALSLCNLASVGIFGIVLSAAFCELEWTRQRKLLLAGCTVLMLALQGVVSLRWSTSFARYLYPVITHLPLVILLAAMTRKALWSLIAVLTAYLCCQLRRWAALLVIALFRCCWHWCTGSRLRCARCRTLRSSCSCSSA